MLMRGDGCYRKIQIKPSLACLSFLLKTTESLKTIRVGVPVPTVGLKSSKYFTIFRNKTMTKRPLEKEPDLQKETFSANNWAIVQQSVIRLFETVSVKIHSKIKTT